MPSPPDRLLPLCIRYGSMEALELPPSAPVRRSSRHSKGVPPPHDPDENYALEALPPRTETKQIS
uniref:Uncharacterized protein n=1 Tax=Physcomitrium patens TaxID=3218 RepID=A0A2K1JDV5_PHYPA|nr:hypothetical protein PHYPA_019986 [Physcomitrium patens]